MHERRKARIGLQVVHRHRAGDITYRRVSELVFVGGRPKAVLGWINAGGGVRTPISSCDLDPKKLRKAAATPKTYYYEDVTVDPRYEPALPADSKPANR
jgi:hypothetical protein